MSVFIKRAANLAGNRQMTSGNFHDVVNWAQLDTAAELPLLCGAEERAGERRCFSKPTADFLNRPSP
jgi:hypothetical protein